MLLEHSSKNKKILLLVSAVILIAGVFLSLYSSVIFQEGNPWPQIKSIAQLKFSGKNIVQLSGSDNKFMTESKNGTIIHDFMKTKGYEFTGQMGSGYFFKSLTGQNAVVTHKYYSRHYSLWTIAENNNSESNNLWTTITNDQSVTFQYPKELLAKYVSVVEWPPIIKIETGAYSCKTTPLEVSSMSNITSERMVDDRTYCVNIKNEGATGSVYSLYTYTTIKSDELVKVSFTLQLANPEIDKNVVVPFTIQDSKSGRESLASEYDLKQLLKKTLENTNWRLMSDGVSYRLGVLNGRLKGYESEEDLLKLVKN